MKFTSNEAKNFRCPKIPQLPYSPNHNTCIGKKCALWVPDNIGRGVPINSSDMKIITIEKTFLGIKYRKKVYDLKDKDHYQAWLDKKYGDGATVFKKVTVPPYLNAVVFYTVEDAFLKGQCGLIHEKNIK